MIDKDERDQEQLAALLRATPPAPVPADFLARVNARIDDTAGWLGLVDFRAWTLRLVPAAVALALVAVLWPSSSTVKPVTETVTNATSAVSESFSPSSSKDWQQDVTANALLEAALKAPDVR